MKSIHGKDIKIFACNSNKKLAEDIAAAMGLPLGRCTVGAFADGEVSISIEESVRGSDVFVVQSTCGPVNNNLMELLIMIDALKRASAGRITAVVPYYSYARQDRKAKARDPISAKLVADLISVAGADRVLSMDLHVAQIQGFFNVPVDHLYASTVFGEYIKSLKLKDMVIASPDVGGSKRANSYAKYFGVPLVLCHKSRAKANEVESMTVIGDVKDKNVILVDDMVDTAGTITKAADLMISKGALSVRAIASHAVMSDPATSRVTESKMTEMIFTDSIPYYKNCPKVHIISIADMFADTIRRVYENESISSQYII